MNDILWATLLTLFIYIVMSYLQKKTKIVLLNPLLFSSVIIIIFLLLTKIPYKQYQEGTGFITFLVGPATVSLAIPLYQNMMILREYWKKIVITILSGVVIHALIIGLMVIIFKFDQELIASFIPKSITTAVASEISNNIGGIVSLTISIVIITGIIGAAVSDFIFKTFKIENPIAKGLSLGISAHALGTSKATSYGNIEASMATLSLILTSIITVLVSPLILKLILLFI